VTGQCFTMSWLASIGVSMLSAIIAGAIGLGIGLACVRWYSISSFEGKSGFFDGTDGVTGEHAALW